MIQEDILKHIKQFSEPKLQEEIIEFCEIKTFKRNDVVVREGEFVKVVPFVLSGLIRVYQTKEDRQILLYHVEPSQTCMMSLSACFFNHQSPSQAVALETTKVLIIPTRLIYKWQKEYASWNEFVIRTFKNRYDELLSTFESVVFDHIDKRIFGYLKKNTNGEKKIKISHQQLADELGTTRVVVSRILKQFELDNKVKLFRGSIKLI